MVDVGDGGGVDGVEQGKGTKAVVSLKRQAMHRDGVVPNPKAKISAQWLSLAVPGLA